MSRVRRSTSTPPDAFPGFTDVVEIGSATLATVYRAREETTRRLVALKLLDVRHASSRALESFERETRALGAVSSHPNIVTLFRTSRAGDGRPVLVLELCRGSIGDRMTNGPGLPAPEVVALGIKIAGALETAHRAAILHRDVTPQNILITEFGQPALAELGLAMLQPATRTTAGLFDDTTVHAAPELLEGAPASAATDVYELASSLYHLVAGRSAFRAYEGESPASVILRILRDPVQPVADAQVPAVLSDLLLRAMAKDQGQRPQTAIEFAAELAAVESAHGWPTTQFVVRDPSGAGVGPPAVAHHPPLRRPPAVEQPAVPDGSNYPIPPIFDPDLADEPTGIEQVPSWALRTPLPPEVPGSASLTDVALDPSSLRRRLTIRAGGCTLTVDDSGLVLRSRLRRTELLPWASVRGFEPRVGPAGEAELVVLTDSRAVRLPATRRSPADLRYVHALLDAYRQRSITRR